jgi:hypothetical protein
MSSRKSFPKVAPIPPAVRVRIGEIQYYRCAGCGKQVAGDYRPNKHCRACMQVNDAIERSRREIEAAT